MENFPSKEEIQAALEDLAKHFPDENLTIEVSYLLRKNGDTAASYLIFVPSVGISVDKPNLAQAVEFIKWKGGIK